jgi:hypothetical protein
MCKTFAVACFSIAIAAAAFASASDNYCPASVTASQEIQNAPAGWALSHGDLPSPLSGITLYSGPPSENASLVYDKWTKRNGFAYAIWKFSRDSKYRIWLRCIYANTTITLDKELPAGISECEVTYDPSVSVAGSPEVKKIACK